jgi:monoamine oxidase
VKRRDFLKRAPLVAASVSAATHGAAQGHFFNRGRPSKKVIVIGAGLAGLSAAFEMTELGHDVTVLEAQGRPGGRVLTLRDAFPEGLYADAGATRIPDHHEITLAYCRRFGLTLDAFQPDLPSVYYVRGRRIAPSPGEKVDWPHRLTPEEHALGLEGMRRKYVWSMLAEVGDVTDPAWPSRMILEKYDGMNRSDFWTSRGASPEAVALMSMGGIDDRAETWSTLLMLRNQALNRKLTRHYRIRGGTDLLPRAFAARMAERILYKAPVVRIEHDPYGVKVVFVQGGSPATMAADHVVCAVPFPVQKNIEVAPSFSVAKQTAIDQLPYLSGSKIFLQARRRFWLDEGRSGFATTDLPISQVWDMSHGQPGSRGILQAFPISVQSRRVTAMSETQRVEFALEQVDKVYPGMKANFEGGVTKCWDDDPWARGASAYYKPGQWGTLQPHVARPEGRIHFAGEHTSVWGDGWMQGALESGARVTREVDGAA